MAPNYSQLSDMRAARLSTAFRLDEDDRHEHAARAWAAARRIDDAMARRLVEADAVAVLFDMATGDESIVPQRAG